MAENTLAYMKLLDTDEVADKILAAIRRVG
jgi:hypothetical protein